MLGLPVWVWVVAALVLALVVAGRTFYGRFRAMCRRVREEVGAFVAERHPEVAVVGEQQGNLVLRMADGSERVWEMADLYAAVARKRGLDVHEGDLASAAALNVHPSTTTRLASRRRPCQLRAALR